MTDEAWIGTVRIARDLGNVATLLPPFVRTLHDLPYRLFEAIQMALMVCGWQDNLEEKEQPPKSIWLNARKLRDHMENVRRNRKREMEGKGSHDIEDPVDNEAARDLIVG